MFARIIRLLGLSTPDQIIGFLVCGMAVLPTILFIGGERNAAAVVMLLMVNALLVFAIRCREREDLHDADEARRGKTGATTHRQDPPDGK